MGGADQIFPSASGWWRFPVNGKSSCCGAPVRVDGKTTHYYVCIKCGKPCDVMPVRPARRKGVRNRNCSL